MKWFARSLVVLTCTAGTLVLAGPPLGATSSRHTAQAPICVSYEGEHVCIQGWSTGVTATYSGSSTDAQGNVFQDGNVLLGQSVGGNPLSLLNVHVNWRGTGTLFLPLPEGIWLVAATIYGNHANRPAGPAYGRLVVGPLEPPPPTTCSTVAQGVASVLIGQAQPWVSGISATMNGDCPGYWIASPAGVVNSVGGAALLGGYNSLDQGMQESPPEASPRRSTAQWLASPAPRIRRAIGSLPRTVASSPSVMLPSTDRWGVHTSTNPLLASPPRQTEEATG